RAPGVHVHQAELASPRTGWAPEAAAALLEHMDGPADLAVSLGLLSQVVWALADAHGGLRGEARGHAERAVRAHLELASLLSPNRLFIVDTAPYETHASAFEALSEHDQLRALAAVEGRGDAIPLTTPRFLTQARIDAGANPVLHAPWIWPVAKTRPFLTYALSETPSP
ncbi:MAG: hypothetical protein AAF411_05385, partial [Myxococcota bacterium]